MKCRFCNRPLRSRLSTRRGYGPDCGRKNRSRIDFDEAEKSGQMNLVNVIELRQRVIEEARNFRANGYQIGQEKKLDRVLRQLDREEGRS